MAVVVALERWGRAREAHAVENPAAMAPRPLPWPAGIAATLACALPVLLGFVVPGAYLVWAAARRVAEFGLPADLAGWIGNSALLAGLATALALLLALPLALGARRERQPGAGAVLLKLGMRAMRCRAGWRRSG